jgi:hypothetical protein
MSPNWIDWVLAVVFGIPVLVVAVCYIAIWAEEAGRDRAEEEARDRHPAGRDL